jgi:predicted Ser/Thr protein kinase
MDEARKKQVQVLEMERERQVKALEEERQEKIRALEKELEDIEVARLEQFEKERRGLEETVKRLASDLDTARKKSEEQDEAIEVLLEEIKVLQQLHDETAVCAC